LDAGDFSWQSQNQNKLHTLVWSKNPEGFGMSGIFVSDIYIYLGFLLF